jgi:hypothetical protein
MNSIVSEINVYGISLRSRCSYLESGNNEGGSFAYKIIALDL